VSAPAGLAGHDADYLTMVWAIACALGVVAIVAMAVLFRRARKTADAEEVDRILAEDDAGERRPSHVARRHGGD